jgi:hypothetical protein
MKSRIARDSGAEKALGPWYVEADFVLDEPPQHAQ